MAAYLTNSVLASQLATISAVASILVLPFTLAFIMPTNKALIALDDQKEFSEAEAKSSSQLIEKWDARHKMRFLFYGTGWLFSLAALVVSIQKHLDVDGLASLLI